MKIQTTKDYKQFKEVKGNREVNDSHVKKLAEYLKIANFLPVNPIIVNEYMEVIDGQHRLAAAKRIGAEVSYIIRDGARLPEVILMNSANKTWNMQDYLKSHIQRGHQTYQIVADFCATYGMSVSQSLEILSGDRHGSIKSFKEGTFQIGNLKLAEEVAIFCKDVKPYTDSGVNVSRDFIRAIYTLLKSRLIDPSVMLRKMAKQKERFTKPASVRDALRRLEDIYNYKQRKQLARFV